MRVQQLVDVLEQDGHELEQLQRLGGSIGNLTREQRVQFEKLLAHQDQLLAFVSKINRNGIALSNASLLHWHNSSGQANLPVEIKDKTYPVPDVLQEIIALPENGRRDFSAG